MKRRPDISRAKALLNWQPTVPLEQGLKRMIAHFKTELGLAGAKDAA